MDKKDIIDVVQATSDLTNALDMVGEKLTPEKYGLLAAIVEKNKELEKMPGFKKVSNSR